jgi:hypothetical protein
VLASVTASFTLKAQALVGREREAFQGLARRRCLK